MPCTNLGPSRRARQSRASVSSQHRFRRPTVILTRVIYLLPPPVEDSTASDAFSPDRGSPWSTVTQRKRPQRWSPRIPARLDGRAAVSLSGDYFECGHTSCI